jgi:hypothetical protein
MSAPGGSGTRATNSVTSASIIAPPFRRVSATR